MSHAVLLIQICFRYKQARTAVDTIFGPKCHKDFPRLYRESDELCSGEGVYPSTLGSDNIEYEHKGIDLITENESPVKFLPRSF